MCVCMCARACTRVRVMANDYKIKWAVNLGKKTVAPICSLNTDIGGKIIYYLTQEDLYCICMCVCASK